VARRLSNEQAALSGEEHLMRLIVMCCLCEKVFDDRENEIGKTRWKERQSYMTTYQLTEADIRVSHGYCPNCLKAYRNFLKLPREYRRAWQKEEKA
jgi:hypothetical protein